MWCLCFDDPVSQYHSYLYSPTDYSTGSAQGLHKAWVVSQKVLASQEGFSISGWSAKDLTKLLTSQGGFSISGNFLTSHAIVNILYVLYHDLFSTCAAISCLQAVEGL